MKGVIVMREKLIKRLNEIKAKCNLLIEELGKLWHMVNDGAYRSYLHSVADKMRDKIKDADNELKKI